LVDSNLLYLNGELGNQKAERVSELGNCAKIAEENVYTFPNGVTFQIIDNASARMDFTVDGPHNFYVTYGEGIHLVSPKGLEAGVHQSGWIITKGAITNWDDIFINGENQTKPIVDNNFNILCLYEYHVISETVIVFNKQSFDGFSQGGNLLPVTMDLVEERFKLRADGTYESSIYMEWSANPASTQPDVSDNPPCQYRVLVQNSSDEILLDTTVNVRNYSYAPVAFFNEEHKVTIYETDGTFLSSPTSTLITPDGDTSGLQETECTANLTLGTDSLWGKNDACDTTFYLDAKNGNVTFGNPEDRHMHYDGLTNIFTTNGTIRMVDIGDPLVDGEFAIFATGDADFDHVEWKPTGTGVLVGSPGLYVVRDGKWTFGADINGDVGFGDLTEGYVYYDNQAPELKLVGIMRIEDIENPPGTITQHGYLVTGSAYYDTATGDFGGSGILVGTPGIYGLWNDELTFYINATNGNVWFNSDNTIIQTPSGDEITVSDLLCMVSRAQHTANLALQKILDMENP